MTTKPIDPLNFGAVLANSKQLLESAPYQSKFIAGRWVEDAFGHRRLAVCSPFEPGAMLSLRGALIVSCGSGPRAWPVIKWLSDIQLLGHSDPFTRQQALTLIDHAYHRLTKQAA